MHIRPSPSGAEGNERWNMIIAYISLSVALILHAVLAAIGTNHERRVENLLWVISTAILLVFARLIEINPK